jgi:hypothetical protein
LQAKAQELFVLQRQSGRFETRCTKLIPWASDEGNFSRFGKERRFSLVLVLVVVLVLDV